MKFVDEFLDYCRDFTACPDIFLKWSAILALSSISGRKHILRRGDWNVHPNLWVLLLGNSSSYKSTGLAAMRRLMYQACPDIMGAQEYSHEKFIEDLSLNPHRLFIYDEAETYLKMLEQNYNASMKAAWLTLWNGHPYRREIKGKDGQGEIVEIKDAYLCWGGASTSVQIAAQMKNGSSDLLSGFLPRFLIVSYFDKEETIEDPPPADNAKRDALIGRLKFLSQIGEREYTYTEEALQAKHLWLKQFSKRLEGADMLLGSFFKKLRDEHFHKLAILAAFDRDSTEISADDVADTSSLLWPVEKAWPHLISKLTEKQWDRDIDRIENYLRGRRGEIISRNDILTTVRGIKAQKLTAILEGLSQDNKITTNIDHSTDRPKTLISWIGP